MFIKEGNRVELPELICDEVSLSARKNTYLLFASREKMPKGNLAKWVGPLKGPTWRYFLQN